VKVVMMEMTNWCVRERRNWRKLNRQQAQESKALLRYIIIFVSWKKSEDLGHNLGHNGDNIEEP